MCGKNAKVALKNQHSINVKNGIVLCFLRFLGKNISKPYFSHEKTPKYLFPNRFLKSKKFDFESSQTFVKTTPLRVKSYEKSFASFPKRENQALMLKLERLIFMLHKKKRFLRFTRLGLVFTLQK